ncbi:putative reverse transcriptase domain-containing protein [Tanacetum coccineum]
MKEETSRKETDRGSIQSVLRFSRSVSRGFLPGLQLVQVEFQIDLIPGAASVSIPSTISLGPIEMKELSEQLQELSAKVPVFLLEDRSEFRISPCLEFIEGFSKIAKSMTKLTQKGIKFDWGEKKENAFQLIKQKLCSAPILALPEGSEDFVVICDCITQRLSCDVNAGRGRVFAMLLDSFKSSLRLNYTTMIWS